jgi:hypothetical protein
MFLFYTSQYRSGCEGRRGLVFLRNADLSQSTLRRDQMTSDTSVISLLGLTT